MNLRHMGLRELRAKYRRQELHPADVVASIYERIDREGERPIWISLAPRRPAIPGNDRLPLWGVPFAVKDNMDVAGMATTAGCPGYSYLATQTAPAVQKLLDAGAILIGKTNMDQFATGLVGTRTPYGACSSVFGKDYISGGSSSGSAVAVASGLVSFSLGTDTAGSGRVPAAFNNVVGLKPTRGVVSTAGVVPACRSLDCVSIFGGDVDDVRLVLDIVSVSGGQTPRAIPAPFRFGVPASAQLDFFGDAESERLYRAAVERLEQAGGKQVAFDLAPFLEAAQLLYAGPFVAERYAAVGDFLRSYTGVTDPIVREIILSGARWTAVDAYRATYRLAELREKTLPTWAAAELLLLPTTPTIFTHAEIAEAPIQRNSILGTYTNFVNLMDLAAVAVPAGFRANGTPFGVSLIGPALTDGALLRLAADYEAVLCSDQSDTIQIAVVGAHLTGQPLNWQLTERNARLVRTIKTSREYRFYALANTQPEKPGLIFEPGFEGPGIELEIWEMPTAQAGSFLKLVAPPLAIGTLRLEDGGQAQGFVCEGFAVGTAREITAFGGWRAYRASLT